MTDTNRRLNSSAYLYLRVDGRTIELRGNRKDVEAAHDAITAAAPHIANGCDLGAR